MSEGKLDQPGSTEVAKDPATSTSERTPAPDTEAAPEKAPTQLADPSPEKSEKRPSPETSEKEPSSETSDKEPSPETSEKEPSPEKRSVEESILESGAAATTSPELEASDKKLMVSDATMTDTIPMGRKHEKTYLATVAGINRLFEFFCCALVITMLSYYFTYWKKKKHVVTPLFLSTSREAFMFVAVFTSGIGNLHIILCELCRSDAGRVMHTTLILFLFDLISFVLLAISSVLLFHLYTMELEEATKVGIAMKRACSGLATIASFFHLMGAICDLVYYVRHKRRRAKDLKEQEVQETHETQDDDTVTTE